MLIHREQVEGIARRTVDGELLNVVLMMPVCRSRIVGMPVRRSFTMRMTVAMHRKVDMRSRGMIVRPIDAVPGVRMRQQMPQKQHRN